MKIVVAGGGAAGFFAAIAACKQNPNADVVLLEKSREWLAKVSISGGGRCNVTNACSLPKELVTHYPRGGKELLGPFHRFGPDQTRAWFEERGVRLKTEADGRVFPVSDSSSSIVTCLLKEAQAVGVELQALKGLKAAFWDAARRQFVTEWSDGSRMESDRLILCTGGNIHSGGWEAAAMLGHGIEPPVPSLFSFHIDDPRLEGLSGLTLVDTEVSLEGTRLRQRGPLLITHWGMSGPAILKLSAWGARVLHERGYAFDLKVNFAPDHKREWLVKRCDEFRATHGRSKVSNQRLVDIPQRLWDRMVTAAGAENTPWAMLSKSAREQLVDAIVQSTFRVTGKSMNKDEFVSCGGVRLSEVNFKTFESRICPGLFFAGEILDIDGVTGGFNFQAAWTGGWIAGQHAAMDETSRSSDPERG